MSISIEMKRQFFKAAEAALNDPELQREPVIRIEIETFRQILEPIAHVLKDDPVYKGRTITIAQQVKELRKMCLEAQVAQPPKDLETKKRRSDLLNTLQILMEKIEEVEHV